MTETLLSLALAFAFGVQSRGAFNETGVIKPGPILRFFQWGPMPYVTFMSLFDVDRDSYGRITGAKRIFTVLLGVMFAVMSAASIVFSIVGLPA